MSLVEVVSVWWRWCEFRGANYIQKVPGGKELRPSNRNSTSKVFEQVEIQLLLKHIDGSSKACTGSVVNYF